MNGQGGSLYLRIKTDINILLTNYFNINRFNQASRQAVRESLKKQIREQNMNSREIDVRGYNG